MENLSQAHEVLRSALQALFVICAEKSGHFYLGSSTNFYKIVILQLFKNFNPSDHRQHIRGLIPTFSSKQRKNIFDLHL